jgi:tRNA G18 (ribose-2'-O)-methylase SpoU
VWYEQCVQQGEVKAELVEQYLTWLSWMKVKLSPPTILKAVADRYHWHIQEARWSLKEHQLLPSIRKGDREPQADFLSIAIYLDNLRSAYNVGSILRTTEALRIGQIHFGGQTPFVDHVKVEHTSMGASCLVTCHQHTSITSLPRPIIAVETGMDAIPVFSYIFPMTCTLVFGNEELGISNEVLQEADVVVEIPLCGVKNSMNVACAFAIVASQIRMQHR